MIKRFAAPFATVVALSVILAGCAGGDEPGGGGGEVADGSLEELIAAAQDEGVLTFYLTPPESTAQKLADAFAEKYDIEAAFVRLTGGELANRYQAEADAGAVVADVVMPSYGDFVVSALEDGTLVDLDEAGIPDYDQYPEAGRELEDGAVAIVQTTPSAISWNTDALGDIPAPESFEDLADPAYAGKLLLTDPSSSPAYLQFWTLMLDTYGEETVQAIADNAKQLFPSVVPMTEALSAGEGAVTGPNVGGVVAGAAANGAPVDLALPEVTTGPEIVLGISADAPSPNAARLFAHFVLSEEGQEIINAAPGDVSPYEEDEMPAGFSRVSLEDAFANEELIYGIFGI